MCYTSFQFLDMTSDFCFRAMSTQISLIIFLFCNVDAQFAGQMKNEILHDDYGKDLKRFRNLVGRSLQTPKSCPTVFADNISGPCVYGCHKLMWIIVNMTKELRETIDLPSEEKVADNQEIMLVPKCPCKPCPNYWQSWKPFTFNIVNTRSGRIVRTLAYSIQYCKGCN